MNTWEYTLKFFAHLICWCSAQRRNELLALNGPLPRTVTTDSLIRFYQSLSDIDYRVVEKEGQLATDRLMELCAASGLPSSMHVVPFQLHRAYCSRIMPAPAGSSRYQFSDDEIVFTITGLVNPIDSYFVIKGFGIQLWAGETAGTTCHVILYVGQELGEACEQFLVRRGACFDSFDDLFAKARKENWQNWQEVELNTTAWLQMWKKHADTLR